MRNIRLTNPAQPTKQTLRRKTPKPAQQTEEANHNNDKTPNQAH